MACGAARSSDWHWRDWVAETLHVMRPKLRRPQCYPLSPPVGEAILRYLRDARPRCEHRAVFLTIKAPFRPLLPLLDGPTSSEAAE
jgi:integrase